jgi:tRNA/rRNA methyltransferase
MNLGQAVALCLYELAGALRAGPQPVAERAATGAESERLTALLVELLETSGYFEANRTSNQEKLRRFVRRLQLSSEDAQLFLGMVRQIRWKLSRAE